MSERKTVRVRIAVAVTPAGQWNSCGFSRSSGEREDDDELMGLAIDPLDDTGEARYFVEADLPIPEPETVEGEVKP